LNPKLGFTSQDQEIRVDHLPISGNMPAWLSGTLIRNGPGKFEAGDQKFRHWFDGPALLHRFSFRDGQVSYANRYLRTRALDLSQKSKKVSLREFGTDPCRSIFGKIFSAFNAHDTTTDNTNVNVSRIGDSFIAMTELPAPLRFDPETLETLGIFEYDDDMTGSTSTAHPHYDAATGEIFNYVSVFGRKNSYQVYHIRKGSRKRELLAVIPAAQAGYMHSFALTEHYVILVEFPLIYNALPMLFGLKTVAEAIEWKPGRSARFHVISRADGSIRATQEAEGFFCFHHINAYEQGDQVVIDLSGYKDDAIIRALYLDHLTSPTYTPVPGEFRRYTLHLSQPTRDVSGYEQITNTSIELPRIRYEQHNGKPYRYAYGISDNPTRQHEFSNQLVKTDTHERTAKVWTQPDCFPGEPVFVPRPVATRTRKMTA
jgi:beta,beta-carotene 9',10'-dioxygenase